MRLEGRMKLGYYPLNSREAQRIRNFLQFPNEPVSVLDPCAGTGTALVARTVAPNDMALNLILAVPWKREQPRALNQPESNSE